MAEMAHDRSVKEEVRFQCHKTIARYVESELKAVEVRTDTPRDYGQLKVILEGEAMEILPVALAAPTNGSGAIEVNDIDSLLDVSSLKE
jgi:hypothetical protein